MIKSTIHRVRAPPHKSKDGMTPERYSIPYVSRVSVLPSDARSCINPQFCSAVRASIVWRQRWG